MQLAWRVVDKDTTRIPCPSGSTMACSPPGAWPATPGDMGTPHASQVEILAAGLTNVQPDESKELYTKTFKASGPAG